MNKYLISAMVLFCTVNTWAQDIKIVQTKGKAQVQWYPERESLTQAKENAVDRAKINALENAFGTLVMEGNSIYIVNKTTGTKTETNSTFKTIGNTAVKGEIIQILKTDIKETKRKEKINRKKVEITYIDCEVTLEAKELTDTKIDVIAYPLNSIKIIRPNTVFYEGDDLFLYFKSPVNGFVTVFLDDRKQAQCLLPYRKMPKGIEEAMPVVADKEYIFFSDKREHNYFEDDFFAEDTYALTSETEKDLNELYVIFSKQPLNKPFLNEAGEGMNKVELLPRVVNSGTFKEWLIKIQQTRRDIQIIKEIISIEKKQ